ncbi:MAG: hypothetical protein Q7S15_01275 [bacterium]|nr:hypothetical protein [bacterium]
MNLKNLFTKFRISKRARGSRQWLVLLLIFFLLNVVNIGWHLYLFWKIQSGEFFIGENRETASTRSIDLKVLEETLEFYRVKDERMKSILAAPLRSIDPSR